MNNTIEFIPQDVGLVAGWKEVPLAECGEQLVPLGMGTKFPHIFTNSIYAAERSDSPYNDKYREIGGSLITMFVREGVALQLLEAQKLLPHAMHIIVYDAYRTYDAQSAIYTNYYSQLKLLYPEWREEQLSAETQKYVSLPSTDPEKRPSPHNTGGSVDVAILRVPDDIQSRIDHIDNLLMSSMSPSQRVQIEIERTKLIAHNAQLLDFGTPFDYGGPEAALCYYENPLRRDSIISENRRLLYHVMISSGFQPYADEWWHYNSPKSQMGAKTARLPYAEYGAAHLTRIDLRHEGIRRLLADDPEMRETQLIPAAIIEPPKIT